MTNHQKSKVFFVHLYLFIHLMKIIAEYY